MLRVEVKPGQLVGYTMLRRGGSDLWYVKFRTPDGREVKRSTLIADNTRNDEVKAIEEAANIIKKEYNPEITVKDMTWEETATRLEEAMKARNLRPKSITEMLSALKQVKPATVLPRALTPTLAKKWLNEYMANGYKRSENGKVKNRSAVTVRSMVRKLKFLWNKWLINVLAICDVNPWLKLELPEADAPEVKFIDDKTVNLFYNWLTAHNKGWWLPVTFFKLKEAAGCRLSDLCEAKTEWLNGDILTLPASVCKTREDRLIPVPADLLEVINQNKGATYLWEAYGVKTRVKRAVQGFTPYRLKTFIENEVKRYNKQAAPEHKVKTHAFRKRVISKGHEIGVDLHTIAGMIGMSPETAQRHYLALDKVKLQTEKFREIQEKLRAKPTEPQAEAKQASIA